MKTYNKTSQLQKDLINALCNIQKMPEGVLPHLVFVEEEEKGNPVYSRYNLINIIPERKSCLLYNPRTKQNEKEEFLLRAINVEWLEKVWKMYLECTGIVEKEEPQLYAFVWHINHMEGNVSDAVILDAGELQDNEEYNVAKFRLNEFAEYVNEDRYNAQECYVRFILTH